MKRIAMTATICGSILVAAPGSAHGQQTLAEKLGYERDAKLLIVHADDIGVARSVNVASARAFENGGITSGSVMVPAPWFADWAAYQREHGPLDVGIHITLTAEWDYYKWGGVLPADEIPSLLDQYGHMYSSVEAVAQHAAPAEVEKEVRAQIERAKALGVVPTHLDTHMGTMLFVPQLVEVYLKLGKEYGLPLMIPRQFLQAVPAEYRDAVAAEHILVEGPYMISAMPTRSWSETYRELIATMGPGLNELIVHLAMDDTEMQGVTINHPDFGSAWRQKDFDFVTSQEFKDLLAAHDIKLVTWDQVRPAMQPARP